MKPEISASYHDWLEQQDMPKGKRAAMSAAVELFSQQGYAGTSTMEIAKRAGISQATIFKYFKTKDDLLQGVLTPMIGNLLPGYRDDFLSQVPTFPSLREEIRYVIRNRFDFVEKNREVVLIFLTELMTNDKIREQFMIFAKETSSQFVDRIYGTLKKSGDLRDDISPMGFFRTIVGQLLIYFIQREKLAPELKTDKEKDLQMIEDLIVRSISK